MWRCRDIPQRSGRTFFRMARTNDNRYEQSPTPFASLEASDHPARGVGAAARIRTVNPLLTKQPRFRCATAARFRQPRYPDRMAPVGCTDGGRSRTVSGVFCSKLPIQKRTGCRWPWVTQPWTARGAAFVPKTLCPTFHRKGGLSSPCGSFPAVPADSVELAAECSSVRNGRLGNDSADLTFLYTHSAVISI